ncbi:MAG: chondroitinase-B domain-containing protein, partial [Porticoccaceae bacterium]|nr:chondroitinase-B domain-containing protein [Porticoccaceae bacterium]
MSQIQAMTYQMVKRSKFALLILVCFGICACSLDKSGSGERLVHSQQDFQEAVKTLEPGDSIVLADGVWKDFEIVFTGVGTAEKPISLTAQTKGKVIISGQSNLRLAGEHLLVSGLVFANG